MPRPNIGRIRRTIRMDPDIDRWLETHSTGEASYSQLARDLLREAIGMWEFRAAAQDRAWGPPLSGRR